MNKSIQQVTKILTANDVGTTGSHQAGIAVPKAGDMLEFFPVLDASEFNPRIRLYGYDTIHQMDVPLTYVYYNGKLHERSTRNEFRLTGLSAFFSRNLAAAGDTLTIKRQSELDYELMLTKFDTQNISLQDDHFSFTITLTGQWSTYRKR